MTQSTDSIMGQVRGENRMTTVNSIMAQEYHGGIDARCTTYTPPQRGMAEHTAQRQ